MKEKIVAVIPAFNEQATIARVVAGAKEYADICIVVDDCSTDETGLKAHAAGATVIRNEKNRGYDAAINEGFRTALAEGAEIIFTIDADGQHSIHDIPRVIGPIVKGEVDLVLGTRDERAQPAEYVYAWYTRSRFGIPDPLCGFKAYRKFVYLRFGPFDSLRSIGTELALRAIANGTRFALIPVTINKRADRSRFYFRRMRGNVRILAALGRVMSRIRHT